MIATDYCPCCKLPLTPYRHTNVGTCNCIPFSECHRCHRCKEHCECDDGPQGDDEWWQETKARLDRAIAEFEERG